MLIAVTIVHVLACVVLVLSVLLQAGKGADMGAVFGGASTTIFGSSGAGNFLTRVTTGAAIIFMITSLTLTYAPRGVISSTVMPESAPIPGAEPAGGDLGAEGAVGDAGEVPVDAGAEAPIAAGDGAAPDAAPAGDAGSGDAPAAGAAPPADAGSAPDAQPAAP